MLERKDDLLANHAAAWALMWLSDNRSAHPTDRKPVWSPNDDDMHRLGRVLDTIPESEKDTRRWLVQVLCNSNDPQASPLLLARLNESEGKVRLEIIKALGGLGGEQAVAALVPLLEQQDHEIRLSAAVALTRLGNDCGPTVIKQCLDDDDPERRQTTVKALAQTCGDVEQRLLSRDIDRMAPWIDPREPITAKRIKKVAKRIGKTTQEVRALYESLATDFCLTFA
ncbi:MAG: HEAT repeat domain-containing protein [Magnetococcales bacterium]|nr:HEAT repeat domain-containing protein [Magnetococcales bacterium]